MKNFIYKTAFVLTFIIILIACEKDSTKPINSHKVSLINQPLEEALPNLINFNNILNQAELTSSDKLRSLNLNVYSRTIKDNNLNNLVFQKKQSTYKIYGLIYFTKNSQLKGIGIHYYSSEKHNNLFDLYKINSNNYEKEFSLIANELAFSELSYLSVNTFIGSDINMIFPTIVDRETVNNSFSDLNLKIQLDFIKNKPIPLAKGNKALDPSSYDGCGVVGNCKTTSGNVCRPGLFHCQEGGDICPNDAVLDFSAANASSGDHDDLVNSGSRENIYRFRDEFLYNSEAGTKYSETFYTVTDQFVDALDLVILAKIVDVMPNIDQATQQLFNTDYSGVIIDNQLRDDVLEITNDLKANSASSIFISEIEQFESDFNTLSLKTRTEIDDEMENL